ncbi:MAG: hypothetical protein ACLSAP_07725 [Oscillospiraceae bacterium]
MIDDLVTKGVSDPYRMMTSRSEYRLVLRQDNADERLTPLGYEIGLISEARYARFLRKMELVQNEIKRLRETVVSPSPELNRILEAKGTAPLQSGIRAAELLKRPQLEYGDCAAFDKTRPPLPREVWEQAQIQIKYEGYIRRQLAQVEEMRRLEQKKLPAGLDYSEISGLRLEAREKLARVQPLSIGQASRISGVSPADVSVLLIYLEQRCRAESGAAKEER